MGKYVYINKKTQDTIETDLEEEEILKQLDPENKFAASLKQQFEEKGFLSESQFYWAVKLVSEKDEEYPCDTAAILEVLQKGKIVVKYPKLNIDLRIYPNGTIYFNGAPVGKYTGTGLNVKGTLDPKVLNQFLLRFVEESPTECFDKIGIKTGNCCYCGKELTHSISKSLGRGPICSDKFGLYFPHMEYTKGMK